MHNVFYVRAPSCRTLIKQLRAPCSAMLPLLIVAAATFRIAPAKLHGGSRLQQADSGDSFVVPVPSAGSTGLACAPLRPLRRTAPNVIIIGDAVSSGQGGYLPQLQRLLSPGLARVQQTSAADDAALTSSAAAAQCADGWLSGKGWDVVVVALGLGDCVGSGANLDTSAFIANL